MSGRPFSTERPRLARFVVVGVAAAGLMFALSYVFRWFGMSGFVATTTAYAIVFALAYLAQRGWTFGGTHSHRRAFPRYLAVQLACGGASGLVGHVSADMLSASPLWMAAAVTVTAGAASYVLSSRWVFAANPSVARPETLA